MNCRHCNTLLEDQLVDLGYAPPSNAYIDADGTKKPEVYFPLRVFVCNSCWLIQTEDYNDADELFAPNYAYFSSTSSSWVAHARAYSEMITERLSLGQNSMVIEVASNDGYLLKNFVEKDIPCLGIEPTISTANAARELGVPVETAFFGASLAKAITQRGQEADLIIGNNVFAHVPDINDFALGLKIALKPTGTITLEFPHALKLIQELQFDTIYHEHYSYLFLHTVTKIFGRAGLRVLDVEELPTHGGSLRVYGIHESDDRETKEAVYELLEHEQMQGMFRKETYSAFQCAVEKIKNDLLTFLIEQKRNGKKVAAYGAAAKGNTLLNYAGVKQDLISCIFDAAPSKQGRFMPGSHIPILPSSDLADAEVDILVILPWNIAEEVVHSHRWFIEGGGQCFTVTPEIKVHQ